MLVMPPSSQGDEHPQPAAEAILVSRFWPIPIESHTIPCQKKLSPVSSRIWKRVLEISLNQGESWLLHAQDVAAAVPNDFSIKQCCGKADILAAGDCISGYLGGSEVEVKSRLQACPNNMVIVLLVTMKTLGPADFVYWSRHIAVQIQFSSCLVRNLCFMAVRVQYFNAWRLIRNSISIQSWCLSMCQGFLWQLWD